MKLHISFAQFNQISARRNAVIHVVTICRDVGSTTKVLLGLSKLRFWSFDF